MYAMSDTLFAAAVSSNLTVHEVALREDFPVLCS